MAEKELIEREPLKNNDKLDVINEQQNQQSSGEQKKPPTETDTEGKAKPAPESAKNSK